MKKIIILILVFTVFSVVFNKTKANVLLIPDEAIRIGLFLIVTMKKNFD
jgi:hypothetical protein